VTDRNTKAPLDFKCNFNFIEISLKFQVQLFVSMKKLAYSRGRLPHVVREPHELA